MNKTERSNLLATRPACSSWYKWHATTRGADYTYCGLVCRYIDEYLPVPMDESIEAYVTCGNCLRIVNGKIEEYNRGVE